MLMNNLFDETSITVFNFSVLQKIDWDFKKKRFLVQDTKKFGCSAKIRLREIIKFPEYKVGVAIPFHLSYNSHIGTIKTIIKLHRYTCILHTYCILKLVQMTGLFFSIQINKNSRGLKEKMSQSLRNALPSGKVLLSKRIYVQFPELPAHHGHVLGQV